MNAFKTGGEPIHSKDLDTRTIKRIVADYYGLTQAQLVSKSRTKAIANARHIAIYLCRKHLDLPYNKIGEDFGNRDHSTIINSCDKIEKNLKTDQLLAKAIYEIENKILVNNIAEQDQTLTPGIKKVRKRGKTVWLDRENRKAKIANDM